MKSKAKAIALLVPSAFHLPAHAFSPLTTTYESYKTYHLDPLTDEFETEALDVLPDATRSKATESMEYWAQHYADARKRLHGMSPMADAAEFDRTHPSHTENWIHYRRALLALVPHHDRQHSADADDGFHWPKHAKTASWSDYSEMVAGLASPAVDVGPSDSSEKKGMFDVISLYNRMWLFSMYVFHHCTSHHSISHTWCSVYTFNAFAKGDVHEKQSKANAFWQATYREEKMKEHMHAIEEEAEESPQYRFNEHSHFDTWGHYKHDYIDSLPPQKSIEQELEGTCSL